MKYIVLGNWSDNVRDNGIEYKTKEEAIEAIEFQNQKLIDDGRSQFYYELFDENMNKIDVFDGEKVTKVGAKTLKEHVLKNHRDWLVGMYSNIVDYPNSLDIAESANESDFRDTMFNGIEHTWVDNKAVVINNVTFNAEFNYSGFSFSVYQNEDDEDMLPLFTELEEEYNFNIPWGEFDSQKDNTIKDLVSAESESMESNDRKDEIEKLAAGQNTTQDYV